MLTRRLSNFAHFALSCLLCTLLLEAAYRALSGAPVLALINWRKENPAEGVCMAGDAKSAERTFMSRWRSWLPPVLVVMVILIALMLLAPDNPGAFFKYRLF